MSKLPEAFQFLDLSDYGRPMARRLVQWLLPTPVGVLTLTWAFTFVGVLAVIFIFREQWVLAGLCLPLKSLLDAADGEMARARQRPSYVGRYLDTVNDGWINFALFYATSRF